MSTSRSAASARAPRAAERNGSETGASLLGSLVGAAAFTMFMLVASQVTLRLYATSVLSDAAERAASMVATSPDPQAEVAAAQADARLEFGLRNSHFVWVEVDAKRVVLEVVSPSPAVISLPVLSAPIRTTVVLRSEGFRG